MDLAKNCEEDFEAAEYGCGENGVASDAHVKGACVFFGARGGRAFSQSSCFFGGVGGK